MKEKIRKAVRENKKIKIQAYSVSRDIEDKTHESLKSILEKHGRSDILPAVYTCVKELMVNAIKANFKNIYFENYKGGSNKEIDYDMFLKMFKSELSRNEAKNFARLARMKDVSAEILLHISDGHLMVRVKNPVRMTEIEKERVSKKIEDSKKYNDISEYFLNEQDDPHQEGAGLGLILIALILKNMGINEDGFSIKSHPDHTEAVIQIPIS